MASSIEGETISVPFTDQQTTAMCPEDAACSQDERISFDANFKLRIAYLVLGSAGVVLNLFVIIVMLSYRHLRTRVTNAFIINQSVIDFLASFFNITTSFLRELPTSGSDLTKEVICRLWMTNLPLWGTFVASTYNVVMMTIERYIAIVYPLKPEWKITRKKSYFLMGTAWFVGLFNQLVYIVPTSTVNSHGECSVLTEWVHPSARLVSVCFIFLLQFLIPLIINTVANIRVNLALKRQAKGSTSDTASDNRKAKMALAQRNVMRTLLLVFTFNLICWVWNAVYILLIALGIAPLLEGFYHFTVMAVYCNSTLNPLVYILQYQQFQEAAVKMLSCKKKKSDQNKHTISAVSDERLDTSGYSYETEGATSTASTRTHL